MHEILEKVYAGHNLSETESEQVFASVLAGELDNIEIAALLTAMKTKGEVPEEIAGAARALRGAAATFPQVDFGFADSCGTGGDGAHTVNISTAAAILAAEAGVPVAKHGNRSVSSKCGSADVLEAVGVNLAASPEASLRCLKEVGICFLFAPHYHPGMRHAMPVRRTLKTRTIFNILGPLANPARPHWQVVGVYDPALCRSVAETLRMLGCKAALVVHGSGLDEVALHGPTVGALWRDGALTDIEIHPEDAGLDCAPLDALKGGDANDNAAWLRDLLGGKGSDAHNAAVAINTGALLWTCGKAANLHDGTLLAQDVLRSGAALIRMQRWVELSHGTG